MGNTGTGAVTCGSGTPFFLVFTDLDGTLLDPETYQWDKALPALDLCRKLKVPVILASSKTRAEMEPLRTQLSLSYPFITENGGGIFFPVSECKERPPGTSQEGDLFRFSLGLPYSELVEALREIREELGWNIKGFSEMTAQEISNLTGMDLESSRLAATREYDEPFIVLDTVQVDQEALFRAAARRGLRVGAGGRFFHLQGRHDKGQAMEKVIMWYGEYHDRITTIALGDSPVDFPMLERADYPVLVGPGQEFPLLKERIPRLILTGELGPGGWNRAVSDILKVKERGDA